MTLLVTGASGLLGGTVARRLADRGERVRVFQRRPSGVPGVEEVLGDLADPSAIDRAVDGVDGVLHLAAKVTMSGPWSQFQAANVDGVAHLLAAIRAHGVRRLVHVSSPSVAHHGRSLVCAGADPADPAGARGNYSRSKAAGELLALAADGPALAVVVVRPHLVWGPGDTQLVGRIVARAAAGRLITIGSGAALIDTTYIDNAAEAIVAALDRVQQAHGRAFVVSNGEPRPVADLVARLCLAAGVAPPTRRVPFRAAWLIGAGVEAVWPVLGRGEDPPLTRFLAEQLATAHWFDQEQTRRALDWVPRVSLEEGFDRLAAWYADRAVPARG